MKRELMVCPLCSSDDIDCDYENDTVKIKCQECTCSVEGQSVTDAIIKWNKRNSIDSCNKKVIDMFYSLEDAVSTLENMSDTIDRVRSEINTSISKLEEIYPARL